MSKAKMKRALISVSDKTGLVAFAKKLRSYGVEIISTGGTLKALQKAKVKAIAIDEVTGFPEMLDGRVKTLHPKIHGGLLYRRDKKAHRDQVKKHEIDGIDLVVVNLYPFENVANQDVELPKAQELIDIGGPSMLRSASKNFDAVTVICDVNDYGRVLDSMKENGGNTSKDLRFDLSCKVFERTAAYDAMIAKKLRTYQKKNSESLPNKIILTLDKKDVLRYGENPHQKAAVYSSGAEIEWNQLHGKKLSYNNLLDMEAAVDIVSEFNESVACVIKHTNPCGIAQNKDLSVAMSDAIDSDPVSAFGGIIGLNKKCDFKTADTLLEKLHFFEIIVAPSYEPKALKALQSRKNVRVIEISNLEKQTAYDIKLLRTGTLVQDKNFPIAHRIKEFKKKVSWATELKLDNEVLEELIFGYQCVKLVKSNAIVLTKGTKTIGIGAGQMSRVDSVRIACEKAGEKRWGSYLASDAFFPMPDSIETAAKNGIKAIIQPGGSIRDADVIRACDFYGLAMAFTGERHFRH